MAVRAFDRGGSPAACEGVRGPFYKREQLVRATVKAVPVEMSRPEPRWCPMGDKSPKANDRQKKQAVLEKNQKQAAAFSKAHPVPSELPKKKGK
jgi:hypothetical protein